jgi:hypothetical protein
VDECDESTSAVAAANRIVGSQINMYNNSCAVMAVEAWRMWNEFPDQRGSPTMTGPLYHFGNDVYDVLADIGYLMSHMVVSPVLDDSFIVRGLFTRSSSYGSYFLRLCLLSALMDKYGESAVRYSDCGNSLHYTNTKSCCNSPRLFRDLAAYVARRRMNAL